MNWAVNYLTKMAMRKRAGPTVGPIGGASPVLGGSGVAPKPQPSPTQPQAVGSGPMSGAMTALRNSTQQAPPSSAAMAARPPAQAAGRQSGMKALGATLPPALSMTGYGAMQNAAKKMMPDGSHIQNVQQPNIRTFLPPLPAQ